MLDVQYHCAHKGDEARCQNSRCGRPITYVVYGLYDARIDDLFYVGSTMYPARRYSDHLHSTRPWNFREAWILSILADGSLPIFVPLYEFTTACELQHLTIEVAVAKQMCEAGHTALCDETVLLLHDRAPVAPEHPMRWVLIEQVTAAYIDLMAEQARRLRFLRELQGEPPRSFQVDEQGSS
jgi:hypothetical protein